MTRQSILQRGPMKTLQSFARAVPSNCLQGSRLSFSSARTRTLATCCCAAKPAPSNQQTRSTHFRASFTFTKQGQTSCNIQWRAPTERSFSTANRSHAASTTHTSSGAGPASSTKTELEKLDWNTFFQLRKSRRRINIVASAGTSVATILSGLFVLAQQDLDPMSVSIFGLDPMLLFGLTIAGFGTVGWLMGPFLGNAAFRLYNTKFREQMTIKEKEFYSRIKRYRVDPSSQSISNPVPDYYGEKISSVAGYRQWMKDQRAYNKKRQSFV